MTSNYLDNEVQDPLASGSGLPGHSEQGNSEQGSSEQGSSEQSVPDAAKHQAGQLGQQATGAGQHVAAVAKDQTLEVAGEARQQAKDLIGQARSELTGQAGEQQQKLAAGMRSLGDELRSMSEQSDQPGPASDLARQAAERSHSVAEWLESREPGALLEDLRSFARQRPGVFLTAAAALGLAAGRLTRGIKDDSSSGSSETGRSSTPTPAQTGAPTTQAPEVAAGAPSFIGGPLTDSSYPPQTGSFAPAGIDQLGQEGTDAYRPEEYGSPGAAEDTVRPYSTSQGAYGSETFREDTP